MNTKTRTKAEVDLDAPLWGSAEIGEYIKRDKDEVAYGYRKGHLDISKVGRLLVSTRRRLNRSLGIGE
jgi:hypothetical protein